MTPVPQATDIIAIPTAWFVLSEISYRMVLAVPTVPVKQREHMFIVKFHYKDHSIFRAFFTKYSLLLRP